MTVIPYNNGVPTALNDPSLDQPQMLINTQSIENILAVDHVSFNASSGGQHAQVSFPQTRTDPTLSGSQGMLYTKTTTATSPYFANAAGAGSLWYGGQGTGQVTEASGGNASNGFVKFPNGIMFSWGIQTGCQQGTVINFAYPFTTSCFNVQISIRRSGTSYRIAQVFPAFNNINFTVGTDATGIDIMYFAVGI
jgi:hypothetical protein